MTIGSLLPFLVLIVAFYFLILRPARARQGAQAAVNSRLRPGVEAMTTSGLFGTVVEVEGDRVVLEIAEGVRVRFVTAAIAKVVDQSSKPGPQVGAIGSSVTAGAYAPSGAGSQLFSLDASGDRRCRTVSRGKPSPRWSMA